MGVLDIWLILSYTLFFLTLMWQLVNSRFLENYYCPCGSCLKVSTTNSGKTMLLNLPEYNTWRKNKNFGVFENKKYPANHMSNGTEKRIIKGLTSKQDPGGSVQIKSINILSERLLYWWYFLAQFRKNNIFCNNI